MLAAFVGKHAAEVTRQNGGTRAINNNQLPEQDPFVHCVGRLIVRASGLNTPPLTTYRWLFAARLVTLGVGNLRVRGENTYCTVNT